MLNWKLYNNGEGRLNWIYIGADKISFSSKIEGNQILVMKVENECRLNLPKI